MNGAIWYISPTCWHQICKKMNSYESNFLVYKGYSLYSVLIMPLFYQVRKTFLNQHF